MPRDAQDRPGGRTQDRTAAELTAVLGGLSRRMRAASPAGSLTPTQRSVVHRVDSGGPTTIAALARAEFVRPQSMRVTVGALEEQGLLTRSPHPTDGRQVVFALTEAGRATLGEVRRAKHDWLAEAIAGTLSPAEQRTLAEATALLQRLVEAGPGATSGGPAE